MQIHRRASLERISNIIKRGSKLSGEVLSSPPHTRSRGQAMELPNVQANVLEKWKC